MKPVNFKATTGVTLTNETYDDGFADYLKSILNYWNQYYSKENCSLSLSKVTTDNTGKTAKLDSGNCAKYLTTLVQPAITDKNITKQDIGATSIQIVWIKKEEVSKSTEPKKEKTKTNKDLGTEIDGESEKEAAKKLAATIFSPFASKIAGSVGNLQLSHHDSDKKLVEEINRIKKLIK
jgi:hypothetical protein